MFGGGGGFGEGGGFGGGLGDGGFTQGGFTSPGGGGDKTRRIRSQNIAPLTTADIASLTHDGNGFFLGDLEIGQVTIVGTVTHVDKSQASVTYTVDDTTAAPVTIKHWYAMETGEEDTGETEEQVIYNEGTYVRVYAQVRSFQNKTSLSALKIKPIEDMDELTTHMLECLKFRMMHNKQQKMNIGGHGMEVGGGFTNQSTSAVTNMGIDKVQSQVFDIIKECDEETGVSISDLRSSLKGLNMTQIRNALDFLSNEGHIYSTIDEDHFKSTG